MYLGNIIKYELRKNKYFKLKIADYFVRHFEVFSDFKSLKIDEISVNIIPRFYELLRDFFEYKGDKFSKQKESTEDLLLHFLAYMDLLKHTKNSLLFSMISKKLDLFFNDKLFSNFTKSELIVLSKFYFSMKTNRRQLKYFSKSISFFFDNSYLYFHKIDKKYVICTMEKKSDRNIIRMNIILSIFFDITHDYDIIWNYHLGMIEYDYFMKIEELAIY